MYSNLKIGRLNHIFKNVKHFSSLEISKCFPQHKSLVVEEFGEPVDCLKLRINKSEDVLPDKLGPNEILVSNLISCVNPADVNVVQGVYGVSPKLPAIIGNEGVARVEAVGSNVKHLEVGDISVGVKSMGYWQTFCVRDSSEFFKVDKDLELTAAAQLKVNPCTAYRMLKDFVQLKPGQVVIQNGANSAVGVYVIQLAKLWGLKTINVIRDRPGKEELVEELKEFGADHVVTDTELSKFDIMKPILNSIGKPKLHLNCVGGKIAMNCHRILENRANTVSYGGMSKQSFPVSVSSNIFKGQNYLGFWMWGWYDDQLKLNNRDEIDSMLNELQQLFIKGHLRPKKSTLISFEDRNQAFLHPNNTKYMFLVNK